jgi:hypothetical protein
MHTGQAIPFTEGFFFCLRGQIFFLDFFAVLIRLYCGFFCFTQFLLDSFKLLPQIIIALAFINIIFDLGLNLVAQLQNFHLMVDQAC